MLYAKEANELSQTQAIENLKAVLGSYYFGDYEFHGQSRITSDMIQVNSIGGVNEAKNSPFKVADLSDTVITLLSSIQTSGNLYDA